MNAPVKKNLLGERIYKGVYEYKNKENTYSEEKFDVYKNSVDSSVSFHSVMRTRVNTGEVLSTKIEYLVSREFVPHKISIEKSLGNKSVTEIYLNNPDNNILNYFFITKDNKKHIEIPVGSKFNVAVPSAATSMLFLRSKKENTTGINYYSILNSQNGWRYQAPPNIKMIVMQRPNTDTHEIKIKEANHTYTQYNLYKHNESGTTDANSSAIEVFISRHVSLPYMIKAGNDTTIQMEDFHDLGSM